MSNLKKRGQEEMVGFVVIIILIAIVFMVFLGISLRKGGEEGTKESKDIYQFLESSMELTTECELRFEENYASLNELFESCFEEETCLNGENSCLILNKTLTELMDVGWDIADVKGYELVSKHISDLSEEEIISLKSGDCAGELKGASFLRPAFPGKIETSLKICV